MPFARIRKLSRILRCKPYRRALRRGVAASTEHERLLRLLDCRTIVDIGAHRGQFALVAHTLIPRARLCCRLLSSRINCILGLLRLA